MSPENEAMLIMMHLATAAALSLLFFPFAALLHPLLGYPFIVVCALAVILVVGTYTDKPWAIKTGGFLLRKARLLPPTTNHAHHRQ